MRTYSGSFQSCPSDDTLRVSRFVFTVPTVITAALLFAGAAPGVALGCPTTQLSGASAAQPYSGATLISPEPAIARPTEVAAIDMDDDGDDQDDPDNASDTTAAEDALWWKAVDVAIRTSPAEGERQPRLDAVAS